MNKKEFDKFIKNFNKFYDDFYSNKSRENVLSEILRNKISISKKKNKNNKIFEMMNTYMDTMEKDGYIFIFTEDKYNYCYLDSKTIYVSIIQYEKANAESIFNLLHEIGHIKTNKPGMKRCEEEFYATEWAIKEINNLNIKLEDRVKTSYQSYIYNWRGSAIRRHAKQVPSIKELTLKW